MVYQDFFRQRLTQLRTEKGVSARDMSLSLGQSESYINRIENGKTLPSMSAFFSICEYFCITPQDFFSTNLKNGKEIEAVKAFRNLSVKKQTHILTIMKDMQD